MTATTAEVQNAETFAADERAVALPLRADTFLGVCEAIGQDLGVNPNWIRIAFAPVLLVSPLTAVGAYLALGGVVAASRWMFPVESRTAPASAQPGAEQNNAEEQEERLAA